MSSQNFADGQSTGAPYWSGGSQLREGWNTRPTVRVSCRFAAVTTNYAGGVFGGRRIRLTRNVMLSVNSWRW